jgi:hypothetical protein
MVMYFRIIFHRQGPTRFSQHHFCLFKACRSDNSDDKLWFEGQKIGFDRNMLWFEDDFGAILGVKNDGF